MEEIPVTMHDNAILTGAQITVPVVVEGNDVQVANCTLIRSFRPDA